MLYVSRISKSNFYKMSSEKDVNETIIKVEVTSKRKAPKKKEKTVPCDLCEKLFINQSTFIIHRRSHTQERPYSCSICSKSFTTLTARNEHEKLHTNVKGMKLTIRLI